MSEEQEPDISIDESPLDEIAFEFIKGSQFRVVHVDGAVGGMTPQGLIHMAIYSERLPIPQRVVHAVTAGRLGEEIREKRITRQAVVRELEVSLMMDAKTAYSLCQMLSDLLTKMGALVVESSATDLAGGDKP